MTGVLVADPGGNPEMPMLAAGLARAGLLDAYIAPVAFTRRHIALARLLPGPLGRRLAKQMSLRAVPPGVSGLTIRNVGTLTELSFIAARRLGMSRRGQRAILFSRNSRFDLGVARLLRNSSRAFVGLYGSSLASLRRSETLGIPSFLEYPIAHHRFARRILLEEAVREPDFKGTLQFHDHPSAHQQRMDDEIATASHIFMLSSHHAQTFLEEGVPENRLTRIHLGVDVDLFKPRTSMRDSGTFRVLFVGQLTQRKGLSYLLNGFANAKIQGSELTLVGRPVGDAVTVIRRWASVRLIPHMPRDLLPSVYYGADAFVLASLVEGFPLTALEAMACGLPVIVSENTFGRDVITDGVDGYVVPIRDSDAIAERLLALAADPTLRQTMGDAAARRARALSWEHYGHRAAEAITGAISFR